MATDEEYLDNLLKAAMEEDDSLQGDVAADGIESVDEDEDWKNSLDEMLASVNTAENEIDSDIDMADIDFSDFTDIMDGSGEEYQEISETGSEELDIMDLGITDLGLDIMDEAMADNVDQPLDEDYEIAQEAINDLLDMTDMEEEGESSQEELDVPEEQTQEEEPKKSRKELKEEKKEQKRLAKERQKDAKKAEKERRKEAKKAGAFSSFIDFLTAEEEDKEETKAKTGEDGDDAGEEEIAEKEASGKKGKKDKKKKKGKKGKEKGEGEEGGEGEEAPDPKKAAKQAKKAMKEQKKQEKAELKANTPRVKVLTKKTSMVLVAFCATIVAAVVFLSVFLSDYVDKTRARQAFNDGNYHEAYLLLYGKDLNSGDNVIYHRVSLMLHLDRKLEVYEYYLNHGEVSQALDTLLQGVAKYNEMVLSDTYGAGDELRSVYLRMLDILSQQYGLNEEEVLEILSYDDNTYSQKIYQITLGVDFGLPGSNSNEPKPPQDILPEEESIINMEATGEGA